MDEKGNNMKALESRLISNHQDARRNKRQGREGKEERKFHFIKHSSSLRPTSNQHKNQMVIQFNYQILSCHSINLQSHTQLTPQDELSMTSASSRGVSIRANRASSACEIFHRVLCACSGYTYIPSLSSSLASSLSQS